MPLENVSAVAIGLPLLALLLLVFVLAGCVCFKDKHNHLQISPIRFSLSSTLTHDRNAVPSIHNQTNNSVSVDHDLDAAKNKVPTLQRKLPEIPINPNPNVHDVIDANESAVVDLQNVDTNSELYATVETSNRHGSNQIIPETNTEVVDNSAYAARNGPIPAQMETVPDLLKSSIKVGVSSGDSDGDNLYSQVHHRYDKVKKENPYARVKGQTSEERDTDTDNYDDPHTYARTNAGRREWERTGNTFEPPPPVPEKNFDPRVNDDDIFAQPSTSTHLTAANAVTGRVSSSEIPYLTSPVESPIHQPLAPRPISQPSIVPDLVYNTSQESSDGQDIRYMSISVREPLANLRSNLERSFQPERQESYYMVVSDDDLEQTYDEIRDQRSDGGNVAYATADNKNVPRELPPVPPPPIDSPPVPPPVESLRSLASGHSKTQTSSSSPVYSNPLAMSSDSDSRHPSPYASSAAVSSSPVSDTSDLYSTVSKPKSYNRRTIHVLEQQSIDEMYAKVLKNKHLSLHCDNNGLSSNSPESKHNKSKILTYPPTAPLPELPSTSFKEPVNRRPKSMVTYSELPEVEKAENKRIPTASSADDIITKIPPIPTADPDYESVSEVNDIYNQIGSIRSFEEPGYERIRENMSNSDEFASGAFDIQPGYETVVEARNLDRNSNVVENELLLDPGYETVNPNIVTSEDVDPGYEEIGRRQMSDMGSESEPGYEQIGRRHLEVEQEPGYEKIKINGESESTSDNFDSADNGYETVNCKNKRHSGYERLASPYDDGEDEFSDPSYEQVNFKLDSSDQGSSHRARESWDLSPRESELFSDEASGSVTSLVEDSSKSSNDIEHIGVVFVERGNKPDENERQNEVNIAEPQYAVVKKKKKKKTEEIDDCNNRGTLIFVHTDGGTQDVARDIQKL